MTIKDMLYHMCDDEVRVYHSYLKEIGNGNTIIEYKDIYVGKIQNIPDEYLGLIVEFFFAKENVINIKVIVEDIK